MCSSLCSLCPFVARNSLNRRVRDRSPGEESQRNDRQGNRSYSLDIHSPDFLALSALFAFSAFKSNTCFGPNYFLDLPFQNEVGLPAKRVRRSSGLASV